jgi:Zn-dependent M28 family amino/carboxypeptidase
VPGANDGGSGVALLAELALELAARRDRPTVDVVFFDAEDWHEIDGKEVSLGARRFAADLAPADRPDVVLIVDMVAGRDLVLDVDLSCQDHPPSYDLTLLLFQLGRGLGLPAFSMKKPQPYKWIGCDHTPFREAGIPSAILIDIDYPPWHTTADVPEACAPESLAQIGRVLEGFVFGA